MVVELDGFPRFLHDSVGLGQPGLEARCTPRCAMEWPTSSRIFGSDWGPPLSQAGFTLEAERRFDIELTPPLPASTGRYAQACLRRGDPASTAGSAPATWPRSTH